MEKTKKTLHLVLKSQWYDMIASGEKKEEYREIKEYWVKRLGFHADVKFDIQQVIFFPPEEIKYDVITFHKGYTKETITIKCEGIKISQGKTQWGAQKGMFYFVLLLGERIYDNQLNKKL